MRSLACRELIRRLIARSPLKRRGILALTALGREQRTMCWRGGWSMQNRCAQICRSGPLMRRVIARSPVIEQSALPWRVQPGSLLPEKLRIDRRAQRHALLVLNSTMSCGAPGF